MRLQLIYTSPCEFTTHGDPRPALAPAFSSASIATTFLCVQAIMRAVNPVPLLHARLKNVTRMARRHPHGTKREKERERERQVEIERESEREIEEERE